jgi:hypothetical protein
MDKTCNKCGKNTAYREFDHEALCTPCTIGRLIEAVEKLMTGYVSVTAEIVYEEKN